MAKSKLWYISTCWEGGHYLEGGHVVVCVSARPSDRDIVAIRSITPRAAGRRFIRNGLPGIVATEEFETYVHGDTPTKEQKRDRIVQRTVRNAKLRIT